MGIEQIQTAKTRRYCPFFQFNWSQMESRRRSEVALTVWFYSPPHAFPPLNPIPLSALIGGVVLLWRALGIFRRGV
jgi:hypothetical protein